MRCLLLLALFAAACSDEPSAAANVAVDIEPLQPYSSATPIRNVAVAVPPLPSETV